MKILYHHRTMGRGAEGVHIQSMVRAFESLGHQVKIISPPSVNPLKEAGSDVFRLESKGSSKDISLFGQSLKLFSRKIPQFAFEVLEILYNCYSIITVLDGIRRFSPELFYERYAFFSIMGGVIAKRKKVQYVLEVNEISGLKRFRGQSFVGLANWVENKIFQNADIIIVVSSFLKKKIAGKGIPQEKILVLPNGVDMNKFTPKLTGHNIRKKYDIHDEDVVIGFVGWFAEWDRLDKLIEVFKNVVNNFGNVKLMLVGDGHIKLDLQQLADGMGIADKVTITGAVPRAKVEEYISAIDIGVLTHSNEFGSPIVLFELMAMGKPVVAPGLDPITDVVDDNRTGLIFYPGDFDAMGDALCRLIIDENLRRKLGSLARTEIIANHTWKRKAELVLITISNCK